MTKLERKDAEKLVNDAPIYHNSRVLLAIAEHLDMLPAEPEPEPMFKPGEPVTHSECPGRHYLLVGPRTVTTRRVWNLVWVDEDGNIINTSGLERYLRPIPRETK